MRSFAQSRIVDGKKSKSQSLVPGVSQYSDEPDVHYDAGTAEHPGSSPLSTAAANRRKVPHESDVFSAASGPEESMDISDRGLLLFGVNYFLGDLS